ncbi:MAG: CBS domain-containing protein [Granulosicoccus sp.]
MNTAGQLLESKNDKIITMAPESTVLDAVRLMAERDIGSVVIVKDDRLAGILTERHYARNVILAGLRSDTTPVSEVMSSSVVCVSPDHTVDECMALMTEHRIRHLPVLDAEKLMGVISIGDLVRSRIADQEEVISQLTEYIQG